MGASSRLVGSQHGHGTAPLGSSGLMLSAVGIRCNAVGRRVDEDGVQQIPDAAEEVGVSLLDTADIYGVRPSAMLEVASAVAL